MANFLMLYFAPLLIGAGVFLGMTRLERADGTRYSRNLAIGAAVVVAVLLYLIFRFTF